MKKNKLLYIITILITLFSFSLDIYADDKAPRYLTCVYKKTDEEGANTKVALQRIEGQLNIYINESNVAITQPGWQKIEILRHEDDGMDKDNYGRLKSCPNSITIKKETYSSQGCLDTNPNTECTTEEKSIMEYYGDKTSGKQELETTLLELVNINETPKGYDDNYGNDPGNPGAPIDPGISGVGKVDTFTTGKTCEVAIEDCKKRNDGFCEGGTGHLATCYYGEYIENEGCHLVSVSFPTKDEIIVKTIDPSYESFIKYKGNSYDFSPIKKAVIDNGGWCLGKIRVSRKVFLDETGADTYVSEPTAENLEYENYYRFSEAGYNIIDPTKLQSDNPDNNNLFGNLSILEKFDCATLLSDSSSKKLLDMIKFAINIVKIAIPILLIGLGILDFAKAIFQGKEDEMKKAQEKFMKRIIIGVCLFLVPTILKIILTIGNSVWGDIISVDFCGIL